MENSVHDNAHEHGIANDQLMDQLGTILAKLPQRIEILLFSQKEEDDVFSRTARQVIRTFQGLSPKIEFKEYDLKDELAGKLKVDSAPTLVFNPEQVSIRWLGAPMGEEGRSFLELIMLLGLGESHLNDPSLQIAKKIDAPRSVKVFVSATCPYCPQQTVNAITIG